MSLHFYKIERQTSRSQTEIYVVTEQLSQFIQQWQVRQEILRLVVNYISPFKFSNEVITNTHRYQTKILESAKHLTRASSILPYDAGFHRLDCNIYRIRISGTEITIGAKDINDLVKTMNSEDSYKDCNKIEKVDGTVLTD